MTTRFLVRAPDHLGDGVMAMPAVARLAAEGRVTVAAPGWAAELYRDLGVRVVPCDQTRSAAAQADVAVLLKPSLSAAWQSRGAPRRVGLPTDHRRLLLTDVVEPALHRADSLLALACAALGVPAEAPALPAFATRSEDCAALPDDLPDDLVLVLPGTASGPTVRWRGFQALVAALGQRAVVTGGPGDADAIAEVGGRALAPLSLAALGALAARASAVIGNDSGLPHLAAAAVRAAGGDTARVHVIYASTDPRLTGPPGSTPWPGPQPDCWPCYAKTCRIGGAPCRDAAADSLLALLGRA